jgi:isoleucyl-tRNA synthetase
MFQKRESLMAIQELLRKEKVIGKSLDSKLTVLKTDPLVVSNALKDFQELINVSQVFITENADVKLISHADGQKCARCWHWEMDIGQNAEHPTICGRCVEAVALLKA